MRYAVVAFITALLFVGGVSYAGAAANEDAVAVLIGNSKYSGSRIPNVDYAHRDAAAFRRFLIDVQGYREGNIIDLRDATQAQMEAALGNDRTHEGTLWQYIRAEGSDVTVFYSGHGVPGLKSGRGYLLPVDADPDKPEINGYPVDTLYANLAKLPSRSVTVYLDACFSGDSAKGMLINATSGIAVSPTLPNLKNKLTILTAASGGQVASWDKQAEHGLFTEHLLSALYGAADAPPYGVADGYVTLGEVKKYLARNMSYAAKRTYGRIQVATIKGTVGTVLASLGTNYPKRPGIKAAGPTVAKSPPPRAAKKLGGCGKLCDREYVKTANQKMIEGQIRAGADIRLIPKSGFNALHTAAIVGNSVAIGTLLKHGADINAPNYNGGGALTLAAASGNVGAMKVLIDAGSDIDGIITSKGGPIVGAVMSRNEEAVRFLLERQADANILLEGGGRPKIGALGMAAGMGNLKMVSLLLDAGAKVNIGAPFGASPILLATDLATNWGKGNSLKAILGLLIANGADANVASEFGDPLLFRALTTVRMLEDEQKGDPAPEIIEMLLNAGADPNIRDRRGSSAFESVNDPKRWAVPTSANRIMRLLLNYGADPDVETTASTSPILMAVFNSNVEGVEDFINAGADIHTVYMDGYTLLQFAAETSNAEILKLILAAGANPTAKNNAGLTAQDLAIKYKKVDNARLLKNVDSADVIIQKRASFQYPLPFKQRRDLVNKLFHKIPHKDFATDLQFTEYPYRVNRADGVPDVVRRSASRFLKRLIDGAVGSYSDSHAKYSGKFDLEVSFRTGAAALSGLQADTYFVEFNAPGFCGSGGCKTHIIFDNGHTWVEVGSPFGCGELAILERRSNGLRDIAYSGCKYSKVHEYKFDGLRYVERKNKY